MKRTATVTHRIVLVSQDLSFRKVHDIRYQSLISKAASGDTSLVEKKGNLFFIVFFKGLNTPIFCMYLLQLMVAGEPGAIGVHAVCRVGLVLASEAGSATIQPRMLAANSVRDLLWETSHAMKDPALVGIELVLRYLLEQLNSCRTTAYE